MANETPCLLPEQDQHSDTCDSRTELTPLPTIHEKYLDPEYHTPDVLYPKVMAAFPKLNRGDGGVEGGLSPVSFDDIESAYTWEDGLKDIEDFDWGERPESQFTSKETISHEHWPIDDSIARRPTSSSQQVPNREICAPLTLVASVPEHQDTNIPQETSTPVYEAVSRSALPSPTLTLSMPQIQHEHTVLTPTTCSSLLPPQLEATKPTLLQPTVSPTVSDQHDTPISPACISSPLAETSVDMYSGKSSSPTPTAEQSDRARNNQAVSEEVTVMDSLVSDARAIDSDTHVLAEQGTDKMSQDIRPKLDPVETVVQQKHVETPIGESCSRQIDSAPEPMEEIRPIQRLSEDMHIVGRSTSETPNACLKEQSMSLPLKTSNLPPASALVAPSVECTQMLGDDEVANNVKDRSSQGMLHEMHRSTGLPTGVVVPSQSKEQDKVVHSSLGALHEPIHPKPDTQDEHPEPVTPDTLHAAKCLLMLQGAPMEESNTSSLVWPVSNTPDYFSSPGLRSPPSLRSRSNSDLPSSPPIDPLLLQLSPNGESRHLPTLLGQLDLENTHASNASAEVEDTPSAGNSVQSERAREILPELSNSNVVSAEESERKDAAAPSISLPPDGDAVELATRSQTQEVGAKPSAPFQQPDNILTNAPSIATSNAALSFHSAAMDQESPSLERVEYCAHLPSHDGPLPSNPGTSPCLLAGLEEAAAADDLSSTIGEASIVIHSEHSQMSPFPWKSPELEEPLERTCEEAPRLLDTSEREPETIEDACRRREISTTRPSESLEVDDESMLDLVKLTPPKPKLVRNLTNMATSGARSPLDVSDEESMLDLVKLTPPKLRPDSIEPEKNAPHFEQTLGSSSSAKLHESLDVSDEESMLTLVKLTTPKSKPDVTAETASQPAELSYRRSERLASVGARNTPDVKLKLQGSATYSPEDTSSNIRSTSPDVSDEESMLTLVKLTPPSQRKLAATSLKDEILKSKSDILDLLDDLQKDVKDSGVLLPLPPQKRSRNQADTSSANALADSHNGPGNVSASEDDVSAKKRVGSAIAAKTTKSQGSTGVTSKGKTGAPARNVRTRSQACEDAEEEEERLESDKDNVGGGPRAPPAKEAPSSEPTSTNTSPSQASPASAAPPSSAAATKKYSPRRIDIPSADYAKKFGFGRPTTRGESRVAKKTLGRNQDSYADKDAESEDDTEDTAPPVILRARGRIKGKANVQAALRAALHPAAKPAATPALKTATKPAAKPTAKSAVRTPTVPKVTLKTLPSSIPKTPAVTTPKKTRATTAAAAASETQITSPTNSWGFRSRRATPGTVKRKRRVSVDDTDAADEDFAPAGKKAKQSVAAPASAKANGVETGTAAKRARPARKK